MDKSAPARRRLALLSSHLRPATSPLKSNCFNPLEVTNCTSSSNAEHTENGCIFCKIVRGESPAIKVYEDDVCLCILDTNPLSCGHSLIIPKCHFSSLKETPPSVVASMFSKVPAISSAVIKATGCDSFNLLVNNGEAAGQVVFHTHIHIIPRKASDCLWASESLRRRPLKLDQEAKKLGENIRENLPSLGNIEDSKGQVSDLIN
ncbi:adenylylsulfatase HINT3 isoform X1 [Nicotiana tabacum]|uniref:Adenylylsulfatase HINT3 isoform X1 n=2 Tax=Nicotiana TaxID=4085 RepID=A0A1S4CGT7_TOBAC|nr:PREDICTED: hit family protein 1 isoform X1 [Nicotiana sylvestris]XP_016500390.1 PREDICTED: uncharacterized HIT-like protein MT1300 isoform X1 [Nicotiana tabacum]